MSAFDVTSLLSLLTLNDKGKAIAQKVKSDPKACAALCANLAADIADVTEKSSVTSLNAFAALAGSSCIHITEPYLVANLPVILAASASKDKDTAAAAVACTDVICNSINGNGLREVLPHLFAATVVGTAWQTRALALNTIAGLTNHAPEQIGFNLPSIVPQVTLSMSEVKKEVKKASFDAMTACCDVIGNKDIEHMTGKIVRSITNPEETPEIMHALAGVTFVQSVQSPALAMVVPLLLRGLRSRVTATRRQSAVIIDNMSKLVDDPVDAAPFLPTLEPALAIAADSMSDPEARKVCEMASKQLIRLSGECAKALLSVRDIDHSVVLAAIEAKCTQQQRTDFALSLSYIANLCCSLMSLKKFSVDIWNSEIKDYLAVVCGEKAVNATKELAAECREMCKSIPVDDPDDDDAEELCNCQFTLAYGTKILLHNTTMRLKRGHKYGLLGGNDSGKTTLMRAIANGSVEGFPDPSTVRVVFVEADILGELSHLSCVDYIMEDPKLKHCSRDEVLAIMANVGFTETGKAKPFHAVSTLSGGWRMKLALARAMLQRADILLLDEPTNHLDVINVAWVKSYINSLKNVTAIMVSHDSGFLNDCCTDMLQIERLKLKTHRGNLAALLEKNPDAHTVTKLKESKLKFKFPQPGPIEGVKSRSKALMTIVHSDFTYPGNTVPTLFDISVKVSMSSRVGCVGENGAGKSTMIKVLTGEVVPQTGEVWKHPNARVAYVAQHAFHHIEDHLNKTPNEYIRWRYANGEDKESLVKVSMVLTDEEMELQKVPFEVTWKDDDGKVQKAKKVVIELLGSRRENKTFKEYEYECKYKDGSEGFLIHKILEKNGWGKGTKAIDSRIAQRAGLYVRTLSSANVEAHLKDCGLDPEFATHYRMSALSGGQKVKVVLAACMWNQPHIIILDEPTNYLDRDSLGALANAVEEYEGGVVIISHNNEFVSTLCPEEWVMDSGHLTTKGDSGWMNRQDDKIVDNQVITEMTDAAGNVTEVKAQKKTLSKRDEKALLKVIKQMIKDEVELDEDQYEMALKNDLL